MYLFVSKFVKTNHVYDITDIQDWAFASLVKFAVA